MPQVPSVLTQWFNKDKTITLNARLGYSHAFVKGGHHVDAFIAYEQSKYDYTGISAYRTNYLSTTIPEIFAGSDVAKDKDNSGSSNANSSSKLSSVVSIMPTKTNI